MQKIYQFIKTTIIGGVIFLVPIIVVIAILGKAFKIMIRVAEPMSAWIPMDTVGGIALANLLAVLAIILCCLIAGVIAKGPFAKRILRSIESNLLLAIPGYTFIKGITESIDQSEASAKSLIPVIVKFDDNAQVAFEIERTDRGYVVVFLPGSPNPWSGSVVYFTEDRVERIELTVTEAINNIRHLGRGSAKIGNRLHRVAQS